MMLEEKFKFGIIEKNLGFTKDKDVQGRVNTHKSYGPYRMVHTTWSVRYVREHQVNTDKGTIS